MKEYPDEYSITDFWLRFMGKERIEKALEVYNKLIERNPDDLEIQLSLM